MIRSRVDFPDPEGPMRETNSPGAILSDTSCSAIVRPAGAANHWVTWSRTIIGVGLGRSFRLRGRGGAAPGDEDTLGSGDDGVQGDPQEGRDQDRGPQV